MQRFEGPLTCARFPPETGSEASTTVYADGPGQAIRPPPVRIGEVDVLPASVVVFVPPLVVAPVAVVSEVTVVGAAVVCRTLGPRA